MQPPDPSPPPSQFEDLDPEPVPHRRRAARWELVLGLLLVAGLLGGGAWDWLHQQQAADAYTAGVRAQAARHWATAEQAFSAAASYQDALGRRDNAARQVQTLTDGYTRLQTLEQAGDWLAVWQLAQTLLQVQPDYRDVAALRTAAYSHLFEAGLAGTIYLQAHGPDPGLYQIAADGTAHRLPGSTAESRVLAVAPDNAHFLYAAASPGASATARPDRLAVGTTGITGTARLLPPTFDAQGSYWMTRDGVWGTDAKDALWFTRLGAPDQGGGLVLTGASQVVGADPTSDALIIAVSGTPGAGQVTRLVRSETGHADIPFPAVAGFFLTGTISPDGRYCALLAEEVDTGISRTLYLVDLQDPTATPRLIDRIAWQGVVLAARARATFTPDRPTSALLVEHEDEHGLTITRWSLSDWQHTLLWRGADTIQRDDRSGISPDGQILAFRTQLNGRAYLAAIPSRSDAPPLVLPLALLPGQNVDVWFAPRGEYLVYRVRNPDGMDKGPTEDLWSLPMPAPNGATPQPLATTRRLYDPADPTLAFPPAGALVVFVAPAGQLVARTLDGQASRVLADGVEAVWTVGAAP